MNRDVLSATKKYNMLSYGDKIVVGLSGGADSVCLTHALVSLRDSLSLEVEAVHVNHGIRGEEALRDEKFCSDFCKSLGIKLTVFRFDIPLECKRSAAGEKGMSALKIRQAKTQKSQQHITLTTVPKPCF